MLRIVLTSLAVSVMVVGGSAARASADGANPKAARPGYVSPQATAVCSGVDCVLGAEDGKAAEVPVPKAPNGQPLYWCEYSPPPPWLMPTPDPHRGEPGRWVLRTCTIGAVAEGRAMRPVVGEVVWQPPAQPSVIALAQSVYRQLKPPSPVLDMSPPPDRPEVVGMPLWLAVSPAIWNPVKVSAAAGAAAVTATATPEKVTWSMGDGHSVDCRGPGTPYPAKATTRTPMLSPTCGYTYLTPSAAARGGTFPVTATVQWRVEWSGSGGLKGTFADLRSTTSTQVKVVEVQAFVTEVDR